VSHMIGLFAKAVVAVLLVLAGGYCFLLDRRLRRRRAEEQPMSAASAEPAGASEIADRMIAVRVVKPLRKPKSTLAKFDATPARSRGTEAL
jgi:hypothetical protein